jgi:uncharacterized delta-60 repeat protein
MLKTTKLDGFRRAWQRAAGTFTMANCVAALIFALPGFGIAQTAGQLDTSFGKGGIVTTTFGLGNPLGAFEQANGDIVVVSTFSEPTTAAAAIGLLRYTSAGQPDATFGTKGSTVTTFPGGINVAPVAFAQQPDGAFIIAVQVQPGEMGLARYTANGGLDTTFGSAGTVTINIPGNDVPTVLLQPNGQIVLGGVAGSGRKLVPNKTVLLRFNSNGAPDPTFGSNGTVLTAGQAPSSVALLSNGDYLVLGSQAGGIEFSSTGALLSTVTPESIAVAATSGSSSVIQPNGESIAVATVSGAVEVALNAQATRFGETGVMDSSFVSTPFSYVNLPASALTTMNNKSTADAVALQTNGQILVGGSLTGSAGAPPPALFGLARLNANGTLDSTFGNGGRVTTAFTGNAGINSLLIEANGDIVAIGGVFNPSTGVGSIALARYLGN